MSPEAREKRNAYARKWRANNKDRVRENNNRYWERKAQRHSNPEYEEVRCDQCGKMLGKVNAVGWVELKCKNCKTQVVYSNDVEALEAL